MDPNANLKEQIEIARRITDDGMEDNADFAQDADRLAELVIELNTWIAGGGFLPSAWSKR